jgi:hypothetical protein
MAEGIDQLQLTSFIVLVVLQLLLILFDCGLWAGKCSGKENSKKKICFRLFVFDFEFKKVTPSLIPKHSF